jgi:hypothetical protein
MVSTRTFTVREAFSTPQRGKSGLSRAYLIEHPGPYPVYSAATTGPLGFVDTFAEDTDALSWSTNGYAGTVTVLRGQFSITADRALARPKIDGLNLDFCRLVLQAKFREAARGRRIDGKKNEYTKLTAALVQDIEFEVPVDDEGNVDQQKQLAFVARYARIATLQKQAQSLKKILLSAVPKASLEGSSTTTIRLLDSSTFAFVRKETTWGKKDWHAIASADENDYPVYSAARGPVAHVKVVTPKLIDASGKNPVVSFAVDGDSSAGGNLVYHTRPFYVSTNRACFVGLNGLVDMEYVFHALSTMKADHGFNFSYKAYKAHLADVEIEFPVTSDGLLDLPRQRLAAARRAKLLTLRGQTLELLDRVASVRISSDSYAD